MRCRIEMPLLVYERRTVFTQSGCAASAFDRWLYANMKSFLPMAHRARRRSHLAWAAASTTKNATALKIFAESSNSFSCQKMDGECFDGIGARRHTLPQPAAAATNPPRLTPTCTPLAAS